MFSLRTLAIHLGELAIILGIARAKVDFLLDIYFAIIGIILMWVIVYLNR